jgi:hypothetical protein
MFTSHEGGFVKWLPRDFYRSLFHGFKRINPTQMIRHHIRESAILPFELTLKVAHLADAEGTPILLDGFVNQGESSGYAKPLIS